MSLAAGALARRTGSFRSLECAFAIETASAAIRAMVSPSTVALAANPQAPPWITRTPKPKLSSSVTDGTLLIAPVVQSGVERRRTLCVR